MSRFSGRNWLQDRPLALQLFILLFIGTVVIGTAAMLYLMFAVFSAASMSAQQWIKCGFFYAMAITADLFVSKIISARISEPFEKLAQSMGRIKNKNWKDKICQVNRKDEIGQIINTLSVIQMNVTEINEDEEFFYQSVSHGLKTPIMVIQNCCTAYQDGIYGSEAIDIIMNESAVLEDGIKKLLYVSSFDHMLGRQSDFVSVDVSELCLECVKRFGVNDKGAAVVCSVPSGSFVSGNRAALETLFGNIIENAIRYVRTTVRISMREDTSSYTVIFENDGDPIPAQTMDILFDKFYKGPMGSFGLGLYIARKIAIFHGGDIWAQNVENGVQFLVELKKAPQAS